MKRCFQFLNYTLAAMLLLSACKKDENRISLTGGSKPVLTASKTAVHLAPGTEDQVAIVFNWTNPNYTFTTGISSHDVNYSLELDTVGGNFMSKNKYTTTIAKDLSRTFTELELNDIMGNSMVLKTGRPYNFETRVISTIGTAGGATQISESVKFTATPFTPPPKVDTPTTSKLYIIGSGTPGGDATGWDNPVPVPTQQFTRVSATKYEITIALIGGKSVLFLPLNGDWGDKYGWAGANNENNPNGDNLRRGGGDIKTPASGNYKVTVDFQLGKFTFTKL